MENHALPPLMIQRTTKGTKRRSDTDWAFGERADLRELSVTLERIVTDVLLLEACNETA